MSVINTRNTQEGVSIQAIDTLSCLLSHVDCTLYALNFGFANFKSYSYFCGWICRLFQYADGLSHSFPGVYVFL